MFCSYADIAMAKYDSSANEFHLKSKIQKRFKDDIFTLWEHGIVTLPLFLDYLNGIDTTGKIKFTMEIAGENGLEFLDLILKIANINNHLLNTSSLKSERKREQKPGKNKIEKER